MRGGAHVADMGDKPTLDTTKDQLRGLEKWWKGKHEDAKNALMQPRMAARHGRVSIVFSSAAFSGFDHSQP
ncbi:MAG TPA: hypothetical protein VD978_35730 [Azospirillum sp.]|nr:hypothetical protein [Azospirillum sp.]